MSHVQKARTDFCGRLLSHMWSHDLNLWHRHGIFREQDNAVIEAWCDKNYDSGCVILCAALEPDVAVRKIPAELWKVESLLCNERCASRQPEFRFALGCWTTVARMSHGVFQECWLVGSDIPIVPNEVAGYPGCCMVCWDDCYNNRPLCEREDCTAQLRSFVVFAYARWCLRWTLCTDVLRCVSITMISLLWDGLKKIDQARLSELAD